MRYLKEEPFFKKVIQILIVCIILIYSYIFLYKFNLYKKIYEYDVKFNNNIIEKLSEYYPEESLELIDELLESNDESKENKSLKEGFSYNDNFWNDNRYSKIIKIDIINFGVILIILIGIVYFSFYKIFVFFNDILDAIGSILKRSYNCTNYKVQEGIMGRIYSELSDLERYIQKKENEAMLEREETKSFIADISHQLKTPLSSIKMSNSILLNDDLKESERKEFLEVSDENIKKLERLIQALIHVSRLEADMIKLDPKRLSIKDTLTKAINSIYVKALEKDIDIEINEFEDFIILHDATWTEEAIVNILDNAIKYNKVGGKIEIKVCDGTNYISISVKDYGIGIDQNDYNNIFKRFYRSKENTTEGSGLGLFLTRRMIEYQGGSISVQSKLGVGSEFKILLRK